ncbi:MAG: type I restriction endonuclease subunit R, partial [Candidatus Margulisiibacteriota bacterium]
VNARIGSLTASKEWFMPWRTVKDQNDKPILEFQIETLIKGFFNKELLLDYLRYFIIFDQDSDNIIKKIAGYHQFHAAREAVRATLIAIAENEQDLSRLSLTTKDREYIGSRKCGVVWHTQGSGKSISMCCYAGKLLQQPEMNNPTIVVVTDRNDLDGQLYETFCNSQDLLKQTPIKADSRDALRAELSARQSGGIIFTTIQKFTTFEDEVDHPSLSGRSNIIVISDEAHRSQYGLLAKLDTKTGQYKYGYAKHMRDALPNASFIGFTGTPVSYAEKDTQAVFGEYVSVYDIEDAVEDKATVPIYYESRLAKLDINQAEIEALNAEVEEVIEDEEDILQREKTKSNWAKLEKLVGAEPRIKQVAEDLVQHFETRINTNIGKAMIVCMSREICVHLYNAITRLRPDWHNEDTEKGEIKIVMTGSAADRELLRPHVYSKQTKKRIEKRFKNPDDPLKLVIVRDMWLTGFDVPCCHTMYVDKPMKGHNLMQAIARVNRIFKDKQGGIVVDYIGIASELKTALKTYTEAHGKGTPTMPDKNAFDILMSKLDVCRSLFHGFDYSRYATDALKLLAPASNHILGRENGKKRFLDNITAVNKAFSLCCTLDEAKVYRKEIAFFNAVKAVITKYTEVETKRIEEEKNSALKQILDNAVIAEGVTDIFKLAGLGKPDIGLLSDEFLAEVRNMPFKNLAIELLAKLLKDSIKSRERRNVVQEKKYSDRLLETLNKYHNRIIETAQVIEELIRMARDIQAA